MPIEYALENKLANKRKNKLVEQLLGILTGLTADGTLNDLEIQMLDTWLTENSGVSDVWPVSDVWGAVKYAKRGKTISEQDRSDLHATLKKLTNNSFSDSGSTSTEVIGIPYYDGSDVTISGKKICLTGSFLFGSRAECEAASTLAGAKCTSKPSFKLDYLVIGTNVSPDWLHTSFGLKIQDAIGFQDAGSGLKILSERSWHEALEKSK